MIHVCIILKIGIKLKLPKTILQKQNELFRRIFFFTYDACMYELKKKDTPKYGYIHSFIR